jgi:hypothetical protein
MKRAICLRRKWVFLGISAAMISLLGAGNSRANELFSESVQVPPLPPTFDLGPVAGWHSFNMLLAGNPVLPTQDATDQNSDPFAVNGVSHITVGPYLPVANDAGATVGPGLVKLPGLTRVSFTGTTDINLGNIPNQNLSNPTDQVQFGLTGPADNSTLQFVSQHWGGNYDTAIAGPNALNYLRGVPVVSITPHPAPPAAPPPASAFKYIVDFIQFTQNGINGSEWAEFPYLPGQQPTFTYGGWADAVNRIHFTNHEIQLSDTMIPLDDLNFADDPPTLTGPTPAFSSATVPDDLVTAVPEPCGGMVVTIAVSTLIRRRKI